MTRARIAILVAPDPEHLSAVVDRWLTRHDVHVRSIAYVATTSSREALILYSETPEPSTAAQEWIGEQLADPRA
jgi:hypothetical protein